jgi:asparagine synthetase B (glutamine-hydrolysing)
MTPIRQLGGLDPNFAWDGDRLYADADFARQENAPIQLRGSATFIGTAGEPQGESAKWRILRDPLGINKLFWAREEDGTVAMAARPRTLVDGGHTLGAIRAIPRGAVIELDPAAIEPVERSLVPSAWTEPPADSAIERVGHQIRGTLDRYLEALASSYPAARAFVCLSGGLDSSGIAVLVHEHFADAVAVSFDLDTPGSASDDRLTAVRLAREFGMPLLEATVSAHALLGELDTVLVQAIDWRDFNVHAGLVNAALAAAIAAAGDYDGKAIVFTGDLANEFLVDYQPERYRGATYYQLPSLDPSALRASLVRGLDTCHREVGVFAAWGLPVVQPYAVAVDAYLALPEEFLRIPDRKERLCRAVFGELLPPYVYSRPKARAQVGGADAGHGVLAVCVDHGVDGAHLRRRFAELHDASEPAELDRFVRAGRYRASAPALPSRAN